MRKEEAEALVSWHQQHSKAPRIEQTVEKLRTAIASQEWPDPILSDALTALTETQQEIHALVSRLSVAEEEWLDREAEVARLTAENETKDCPVCPAGTRHGNKHFHDAFFPEEPSSLSAAVETLEKALKGIEEYIRWHGPVHVGECPEDDTCDCEGRPINDGINDAHRSLQALAKQLQGVPETPETSSR